MYNGRCAKCNKRHPGWNAICPQCREFDPGYEYRNLLKDLGKFILWASIAALILYLMLKIYPLFS